ncbi:putative GTP-binding protein EngB [Clostridium pasteurianum DSM 525 = ATCC 6013]|uniref:Probable GTP-binding protein EngB n=1 Tax=Clostridium pasteurianum DSM 525 = ATCC 6013 TaxID=1262449 RepID=A0A0H3J477_CLOPA|nr:ribosome biogenesis GTP-binding protein YihA/YsxC [Clostridium pasteurianum]AJA48741.1 putative GTP-binding protein EngB [Clostridium pasteurianum DSM 525 = ATCC 6013]AJA52729.1 putative GTP-binding protein EngB [Clostridium pasteurianum DSM 525 = ATCC 6013]AOZ75964.1 GTP-binding protein [Clostridium pasteurianum DSM 525 = ATCC 6013]AOZ79760.1 GTP-binding protein [Clostridium pasteurianum]ELP60040.1 GTP-binding protein YsxC [Clostridium pasteurianum DSM 525 = ATCC 6013]
MEIKQAEFIISAVKREQYPKDQLPEIAFVGRSNVGKSSIINALTNRKKLVKVSGTPGKTRLINFFLINDNSYFVDLPGYGYAKISKEQKKDWGKIIETYLKNRNPLKKVVLLLDCRRIPNEDDILMYNWIKHYGYNCMIISTKSDKLNRSELSKSENTIRKTLKLQENEKISFYSSLKKAGTEELLDKIFSEVI